MPVVPHQRLTFSGVFGSVASPVEIWNWGLALERIVDVGQMETGVAAARQAWVTHLAPIQPPSVNLTRVRIADINELGRVNVTSTGAYVQRDAVTPAAGTGSAGTAVMPLQTATVVSLMTNRAGPTGKGRFFLPWTHQPLQNDFRMTEAASTTVATALKSFLNAVVAGFTVSGITPVPRLVVSSSKGYLSPVTGVRVGRVPDTMRSRRSALLEGYSTLTL
jgi:hypothetical protein